MANDPTPDPAKGVRRFLADLRAGVERRARRDRRQSDRRNRNRAVAEERRQSDRRSGADRRAAEDRRESLVSQYTWEETETIREMRAHPDHGVACPRCDGNLMLGPTESREGVNMQEVHCTGCRYSTVLVDVP